MTTGSTDKSMPGKLSRLLNYIAVNPVFAYVSMALLQLKVMAWVWQYRDLTPGDTSYYYSQVFTWLDEAKISSLSSSIYILFLSTLHRLLKDPFWVLTVTRIGAAVCVSLLILALMRRLLPRYMAWIIAAWWVILPVNFDTLYSVHLFSALFVLLIFVTAAYFNNIYGRGMVLGGLLFTGLLIRNEYIILFAFWLLAIIGYEIYDRRRKDHSPSFKKYLTAYILPLITVLIVTGIFQARIPHQPAAGAGAETRETHTFCQHYAYNRTQQGDPWKGNPWTDCQNIVKRDFGQSSVTFSQAFLLNPRAMLKHVRWNIGLIQAGTQLALFNTYAGGPNPDLIKTGTSPLVWLPFWLILTLAFLGAVTYLVIPGLKKHQAVENTFVWLLMLTAALLVLGIVMLVRPRPSYMYPYTIFIMALAGLGLHGLLEYLHLTKILRPWCPVAAVVLLLSVPVYYNSDYTNPFGYRGQRLHHKYAQLSPYIGREQLESSALLLAPAGGYDYDSLCNYLGVTCLTHDLEGDIATEILPGLAATAAAADGKKKNLYVLYLEDMIWYFSPGSGGGTAYPMKYVELQCSGRTGSIITCRDGTIDLDRGVMNDGVANIPLISVLFVKNGYVVDRKDYRNREGYYLQILMRENRINLILVADAALFRTNFNQQFLLGNFDRRFFKEAANKFPEIRLLKISNDVLQDAAQ